MTEIINKSEIVARIGKKLTHIPLEDINLGINLILREMRKALSEKQIISIRGFGTLSLKQHASRNLYDLTTGKTRLIPPRHVPHFKPGKALKKL